MGNDCAVEESASEEYCAQMHATGVTPDCLPCLIRYHTDGAGMIDVSPERSEDMAFD